MKSANKKKLTRAAVLRAFASPGRSNADTRAIVAKFMASSPVPPVWTLTGVRGTFGQVIARRWARHLRHRGQASLISPRGQRIVSFVQTSHDLQSLKSLYPDA